MTHIRHQLLLMVLCLTAATLSVSPAGAGPIGRALERGAARSLSRSAGRSAERGAVRPRSRAFFRQERVRDLRTAPRPMAQQRTVYRYVPSPTARLEAKRGIAPGKHMTSRPARGRPLGATRAQQAYGLPKKPGAVETVRIPAKQPVRLNKVLGGAPGRGEATSPKHLPPEAVRSVHKLH